MNVEVVSKKLKFSISSIKELKPIVVMLTNVRKEIFVRIWLNARILKALIAVSAKSGIKATHAQTLTSVLIEQQLVERNHTA